MTTMSFNVAKEDALAMACQYYATSATVRSNRFKSQIAVGLILGGAGLLALVGTGQLSGSGVVGVILLVCAGVSVGFVPGWYRHSLRRSAERMFEESSYRKAFGSYCLTLDEDGLASKSPTGEGKYTWEAVNSVVLTPEHLFIFLVGPQGFAIPRSQVPGSTIQDAKAFVESHIRTTKPDTAPNGRPTTPADNPRVTGAPPSVS